MNKTLRSLLRLALVAGFLLLVGSHSVAQSPAESDPTQSGGASDESLETFVPTEKVPADTGVSFPVDI
jgi:hypothetical protein